MAKVLVVGQIPPPYNGEAMMVERLVRSEMRDVELRHLRLALSADVNEVGRFRWTKLLRLFPIIAGMYRARLVEGTRILYFTPARPTRMSMFRDFVILISTRFLFSKTIFHFHSSGHSQLYAQLPAWQRWLFRRAYFGADGAIRISELTPDDGRQLEARRDYIVPNGIEDPGEPAPRPPSAERTSAAEPLRVLFVSVLYEAKGLLVLIEACQQLAARGIPYRLEIMGQFQTEEFKARVHERIAELNMESQVCFPGQLTGAEKFAAFERADVLCHPTYHDTFPVVLLEAMACRLPVVATRWSGIPSIVEEDVTGFLVEPRDPQAVADKLAELAQDEPLRQRMGTAGRDRFLREFTLSRHIERMRQAFLDVAQESDVAEACLAASATESREPVAASAAER
jgi:glycosyltransferase involved in cell wall biosynthesis